MNGRSVASRYPSFGPRASSAMTWQRAIPLAGLLPQRPIRVELLGRAVMLVLLTDGVHALGDVCPHNGTSLSEGVVKGDCVTCPSHLWRFSLIDGLKQGDPRTRLAVYPTRIIESWVEVDLTPAAVQRSLREALLAHARGADVDSYGGAS